MLSNLPEVMQLIGGTARIWSYLANSRFHILIHLTILIIFMQMQ